MHDLRDSKHGSLNGSGTRADEMLTYTARTSVRRLGGGALSLTALMADTIEGVRWLATVLGGNNPLVTLHSLWRVRWAWASARYLPRGGWATFMTGLEEQEREAQIYPGVRLVPLAVRLLDTPNRMAAFAAAILLKEWGHPIGLASLLGYLGASDPGHRARVVRYLGECEDPSLEGHLLPLLEDPSERVRMEAVRAVARSAGRKAVAHLRPRLSDEPSPEVRAMLAACIGLLQARASYEP